MHDEELFKSENNSYDDINDFDDYTPEEEETYTAAEETGQTEESVQAEDSEADSDIASYDNEAEDEFEYHEQSEQKPEPEADAESETESEQIEEITQESLADDEYEESTTQAQTAPGFAIKYPGMVLVVQLLLVVGILACIVGVFSVSYKITEEQKVVLLTQTEHATVDYDVQIRENEFFEEFSLDQDAYYIRSIVEQINAKFNYSYQSTSPSDLWMTYQVTGTVSANYKDSEGEKQVWTQTDILCDTQDYVGEYDNVSFTVPVSFDPTLYSDTIARFEQEMGISVVAYYTVNLQVKTMATLDNETLGNVYNCSFVVPLTGSVFMITADKKEPVVSVLNRSIPPKSVVNWGATVLLIILAAALAYALVEFMRRVKQEREKYDSSFYELVNSINDRIVYVSKPLEYTKDCVMVSDFDSFIRLADERSLPIFCFRSEDVLEETAFYINDNGQQYVCLYKKE